MPFRSAAERLLFSTVENSDENLAEAMFYFYSTLDNESPEWHFNLFDRLTMLADDDVITSFLNKTTYVEYKWGGLYKNFHPEIFSFLPSESRQLLISKLETGLITLFEAQAIDDLSSAKDLALKENSLAYYSDLIGEDPYEPSYYVERGKILADEYKDHKQAIEDYNYSISLDESFSDAYFYRSLSREKLNDIAGSIADYDKVLIYEPDNVYALGNRAIMKHEIGDYTGAIEDYTETISIDSAYVDAFYGRALSKSYIGDTLGALSDYESTIQIDSYYRRSYINRALINLELKKEEKALDDYSTVLTIEENNIDGLYGMAYTFYRMDSLDLSKEYYEKLVLEYPSEAGAFYSLGIIYHEQEEYKKAFSFLTKTIFMDTAYYDAFLQRGLTSLNLGDTINACLDWIKAEHNGMQDASKYLTTYCKN